MPSVQPFILINERLTFSTLLFGLFYHSYLSNKYTQVAILLYV